MNYKTINLNFDYFLIFVNCLLALKASNECFPLSFPWFTFNGIFVLFFNDGGLFNNLFNMLWSTLDVLKTEYLGLCGTGFNLLFDVVWVFFFAKTLKFDLFKFELIDIELSFIFSFEFFILSFFLSLEFIFDFELLFVFIFLLSSLLFLSLSFSFFDCSLLLIELE